MQDQNVSVAIGVHVSHSAAQLHKQVHIQRQEFPPTFPIKLTFSLFHYMTFLLFQD